MKKIKLFDPLIGKNEEKAVLKVLKSKFWASGSGVNKVQEFENKLKKYLNSNSCVALSNGTAALHLSLAMLDIKNKEVLVPSLTFISTIHAILYNSGIPKFIDVEPKTLCMDSSQIEENINSKTKLILPVHFGGIPCNIREISRISKKKSIDVVEDAAHAMGSTYSNKKIGTHSEMVCFSFHPVKNLAMPVGGAISLNGKKSGNREKILRAMRWCGITDRKGPKYDVKYLGWNYYMNEFSAAIGIEQLKKIDQMNRKRKLSAKRYFEEIKTEKKMPYEKGCAYHLFWIQVKNRTEFMKLMLKNGVETGIHYKPIHKMRFYRNNIKLKNTEKASSRIVSLPMHSNLSDSDVSYIIKSVNKFAKY